MKKKNEKITAKFAGCYNTREKKTFYKVMSTVLSNTFQKSKQKTSLREQYPRNRLYRASHIPPNDFFFLPRKKPYFSMGKYAGGLERRKGEEGYQLGIAFHTP